MAKVREDCGVAIGEFKTQVGEWAQRIRQEVGASQAGGSTGPGAGGGSVGKIMVDKKDMAVWKLQDTITKLDFRHWLDAIDSEFGTIHHRPYPEVVLDKVRRSKTTITAKN